MKIALAQTKPVRADLEQNLRDHQKLVTSAAELGADLVLFPELSLTGYEPSQAWKLATHERDERLMPFHKLATQHDLSIGMGLPLRSPSGIHISQVFFHPTHPVEVYHKHYLHPDEEPFFVKGFNNAVVLKAYPHVAMAICYELSIPQHVSEAARHKASIYLTSVAKTEGGMEKATTRLSTIASQHQMIVGMANCVGPSEDGVCVGKTSFWNRDGKLTGQLDETHEGLLLLETTTGELQMEKFAASE